MSSTPLLAPPFMYIFFIIDFLHQVLSTRFLFQVFIDCFSVFVHHLFFVNFDLIFVFPLYFNLRMYFLFRCFIQQLTNLFNHFHLSDFYFKPSWFLSTYLLIYLSTYLPVYLSTYLPVYLSIFQYQPVNMSTYLSVYLYTCQLLTC